MAEELKKPNIKSNLVLLHRHSEKKPIGSHSVPDLNLRKRGNDTSLSIVANLSKSGEEAWHCLFDIHIVNNGYYTNDEPRIPYMVSSTFLEHF